MERGGVIRNEIRLKSRVFLCSGRKIPQRSQGRKGRALLRAAEQGAKRSGVAIAVALAPAFVWA